jgi:hypothetical protein
LSKDAETIAIYDGDHVFISQVHKQTTCRRIQRQGLKMH